MKKIYLLLGLVSTLSFARSQQFAANYTTTDNTTEPTPVKVLLKKNGEYVRGYINNVPSAVLSDFAKRFDDPVVVSWRVEETDIIGTFHQGMESIVVYYKKDGYLTSARRTYDETKLEETIKTHLRSDLKKGYRIHLVTEVIGGDNILYEVNLVHQQQVCVIHLSKKRNGDTVIDSRFCFIQVPVDDI